MKQLQIAHLKDIAFFNSSLCQSMIDDLIRTKITLNNEDFAYNTSTLKKQLSWEYIDNSYIHLLFSVMSSQQIGIDDKTEISTDESLIFSNYSVVKKGITVQVMSGQGTSITLIPPQKQY